jgi:hypothetical protein
LLIRLASDIPHNTNYQPGYERLFRDSEGLYRVQIPTEGAEVARYLLSLPRECLNQMGAAGQRFVADKLEAAKVYAGVVRVIRERLFGGTE